MRGSNQAALPSDADKAARPVKTSGLTPAQMAQILVAFVGREVLDALSRKRGGGVSAGPFTT